MRSMHRVLAAAGLCLSAATLAAASDRPDARSGPDLQILERELVTMLAQLTNMGGADPVYRRHSADVHSLTLELGRADAARYDKAAAAEDLRLLAVGQQASNPTNPRFLSNSIVLREGTVQVFWWGVYNPADDGQRAKTTVTVKGAGQVFLSEKERITYPPGVSIFWVGRNSTPANELSRPGTYFNKVTIQGAGKRRTDFIVE